MRWMYAARRWRASMVPPSSSSRRSSMASRPVFPAVTLRSISVAASKPVGAFDSSLRPASNRLRRRSISAFILESSGASAFAEPAYLARMSALDVPSGTPRMIVPSGIRTSMRHLYYRSEKFTTFGFGFAFSFALSPGDVAPKSGSTPSKPACLRSRRYMRSSA